MKTVPKGEPFLTHTKLSFPLVDANRLSRGVVGCASHHHSRRPTSHFGTSLRGRRFRSRMVEHNSAGSSRNEGRALFSVSTRRLAFHSCKPHLLLQSAEAFDFHYLDRPLQPFGRSLAANLPWIPRFRSVCSLLKTNVIKLWRRGWDSNPRD